MRADPPPPGEGEELRHEPSLHRAPSPASSSLDQHLHSRTANAPPPGFCVGAGPPALGSSGPVRRREGEGARDARSMTDPRALKPCGSKAARPRAGRVGLSARCCRLFGLQRRKTAVFPASRARCLRLAPWDPRWTDFSGAVSFSHWLGVQRLSTAVGLGRCERGRTLRTHLPSYPVARSRRAGTPRLGPPPSPCVGLPAATAPTRPDVSGAGPEGRGAHLRHRTSSRPRVSSALERALGGTGRTINIFL